jgi:outer membrane receptor protein involved in Fe transport
MVLKINTKLAFAVSAALGVYAYASHAVAQSVPEAAADTGGLEEIIVTAQRRAQSIQDVPMTIQAISGQQLEQLNVTSIEEAVKLLPNVTIATNGPGSGDIQMRGLSAGFRGGQSAGTISPFPTVALYLDEESMQFPARNADVYFVDMERIEALEGPQGTLYGGSAEAGAIRYITNKPNLDKTEGNAEASYGFTAGGANNSSVNAVLNVPIIPGTLAVRAVIYDDKRGGYITNVYSEFVRSANDVDPPPALSATANNASLVGPDSNPVEYQGARLSIAAKFNENWDLLVAQSFQDLDTQGEFTQYPIGSNLQTLGPWQDTAFSPAWDHDHYENTAWTLNGKVGDFSLLYTGSYLDRNINQQNDYSNYTRSGGGYYYSCSGGPNSVTANLHGANAHATPQCFSPVTNWNDQVQNVHETQEFRISTPDDWRLRGLFGAYWENFIIRDQMNFNYDTNPTCTPANLANDATTPCVGTVAMNPAAAYNNNPNVRGDNVAFGEDDKRGYKQTAFFISGDYDIIPKVLTVSAGTRYYNYGEYLEGQQFSDTACTNVANGTCINGPLFNDHRTDHGFKSRANLTWHVTPDAMVYYTFSQGFRPGTFDRSTAIELPLLATGGKCHSSLNTGGVPDYVANECQYHKPLEAFPDTLVNQEIGWKSEFFDHHLLINGSAYHMVWSNIQLGIYDPYDGFGNTTFPVNGPTYAYNGMELQLEARVAQGLTISSSGVWNHAWQTNSPCLISNVPTSPTFGECITASTRGPLHNLLGVAGSVPAFSPDLQGNLRIRYDWMANDYKMFAMVGGNYVGGMWNQPASYASGAGLLVPYTTTLRYYQSSYDTFDASYGIEKDAWHAELYGTNLSNSDASTFTCSCQYIKTEVPLRPRVVGLKVGFKF